MDENKTEELNNFIKTWSTHGDEVADKDTYWNTLLRILGVPQAQIDDNSYIKYEKKINWRESKFHGAIDAYIPKTRVLIEQKSFSVDLAKPEIRPNGGDKTPITPFQQAKRYDDFLPQSEKAKFFVLCNFAEIWIYDRRTNLDAKPIKLKLSDLKKQLHVLDFMVKTGIKNLPLEKEKEVSVAAGELVSKMYNELVNIFKQYKDIDPKEAQRSINALCVRLVFCLYAEDAGLFSTKEEFYNYLEPVAPNRMGIALKRLFEVLDMDDDERLKKDPFFKTDNPQLAAFPYVNGGLFSDQSIVVPPFTSELKDILLNKASRGFDWSDISPTIFGAVFESTLNPETRRQGGMHYTSVENIHKVIDPLFLDDLKAELQKIEDTYVQPAALKEHARKFQQKLASLSFFDPACGSGNFLTETYLSLRKLENEAIKIIYADKIKARNNALSRSTLNFYKGSRFEDSDINYRNDPRFDVGQAKDIIKVSIQQFYGIEINDFAVSVAKTALWIAESQMMDATKNIFYANWDFLPLKTYTHIHEGNALRMDWNKTINNDPTKPNIMVSYIIGNPPFVGLSSVSSKNKELKKEQTADMNTVFKKLPKHGKLDYVTAWYEKACNYMQGTNIRASFVSTNSITQGEQANILWTHLNTDKHLTIIFAYRSFNWNNEAKKAAQIVCVIIGFTCGTYQGKKLLIDEKGTASYVQNINGYLINFDNIYLKSRNIIPPYNMPKMIQGSKAWDGGGLTLTSNEYSKFIKQYPNLKNLIKPYIGGRELIHNKKRYCFWLVNIDPAKFSNNKYIKDRLQKVIATRENTTTAAVRENARVTPFLFSQIRQPNTDYIAVPRVSSDMRNYLPIDMINKNVIASDQIYLIPTNDLWIFSVLISSLHFSWIKVVAGRLGTDFRYSPFIYASFPWLPFSKAQKAKLGVSAQGILNARANYPMSSLADLYNPLTMPPDLLKAHQANDRAVMQAYGMKSTMSESEIVAQLFKMYEKLTQKS